MLDVTPTPLPDLMVLTPRRIGDTRGWFSEAWSRDRMAAAGLHYDFVQDNHSFSAATGTLRGLHFQAPPMAQAKLVRCGQGALFDVAVDVRRGSPSFGQWYGTELSAQNGAHLLVPRGFLHGFVTRAPNTEVIYKVDAGYAPELEGAIRFDDPGLGIDWGLARAAPVLSDKDAAAGAFADFETPFVYEARP